MVFAYLPNELRFLFNLFVSMGFRSRCGFQFLCVRSLFIHHQLCTSSISLSVCVCVYRCCGRHIFTLLYEILRPFSPKNKLILSKWAQLEWVKFKYYSIAIYHILHLHGLVRMGSVTWNLHINKWHDLQHELKFHFLSNVVSACVYTTHICLHDVPTMCLSYGTLNQWKENKCTNEMNPSC